MHAYCGEHRENRTSAQRQDMDAHTLIHWWKQNILNNHQCGFQFTCHEVALTVIQWIDPHGAIAGPPK